MQQQLKSKDKAGGFKHDKHKRYRKHVKDMKEHIKDMKEHYQMIVVHGSSFPSKNGIQSRFCFP